MHNNKCPTVINLPGKLAVGSDFAFYHSHRFLFYSRVSSKRQSPSTGTDREGGGQARAKKQPAGVREVKKGGDRDRVSAGVSNTDTVILIIRWSCTAVNSFRTTTRLIQLC